MLRQVVNRFRASREWVAALDLASRGDFLDAMVHLDKMERLLNSAGASQSAAAVYMKLLKSVVQLQLGHFDEAAANVKELEPIFAEGVSAKNDYLRGYLSILSRELVREHQELAMNPRLAILLKFPLKGVNVDAVPEDIKKNFPYPSEYT